MMTDTPKIVRWKVWGRATSDSEVTRKEYIRETAHKYVMSERGRNRFVDKSSRYHRHFDTEQEALDYVAANRVARDERAANRVARDERAAAQRVRYAAPDLLAALEGMIAGLDIKPEITVEDRVSAWAVACDNARAAIAKAKGEA